MSRHIKCSECMWWWDLYDTDERICYYRDSKFFHKQTAPDNKCKDGCRLLSPSSEVNLGRYEPKEKRNNESNPHKQAKP